VDCFSWFCCALASFIGPGFVWGGGCGVFLLGYACVLVCVVGGVWIFCLCVFFVFVIREYAFCFLCLFFGVFVFCSFLVFVLIGFWWVEGWWDIRGCLFGCWCLVFFLLGLLVYV